MSAFINYGKDSYKNILSKMKTSWKMKGQKASWMSVSLWEKWLVHWGDPNVKASFEIASKNQRTGVGGVGFSTHAGGSVSMSQKMHIMEAQNGGNKVNMLDLYVSYNTKKDENGNVRKNENGEVVFDHPLKKRVFNDYMAHVCPTSIPEGDVEGEVEAFDVPFNPDKWIESSGGLNKGHVFGFRPKNALFDEVNASQLTTKSLGPRTLLEAK